MRPSNAVYVGGPALDPPEHGFLHTCHKCRKQNDSSDYRSNDGYCPKCDAAYKPDGHEDD